MKLLPFNLEQALAGKPFTNDKGWTVEDWHYFKGAIRPISIKWEETDYVYVHNESDLFMLPEKKKVWIVVYEKTGTCRTTISTAVFSSTTLIDDFIRTCGGNHLETIEKEY